VTGRVRIGEFTFGSYDRQSLGADVPDTEPDLGCQRTMEWWRAVCLKKVPLDPAGEIV
jgi:hypothetical protein